MQWLVNNDDVINYQRVTYRSQRVFRDLQLTQALETLLSVSAGAGAVIVVAIREVKHRRWKEHAAFEPKGMIVTSILIPRLV
jgi:hypothetical protein